VNLCIERTRQVLPRPRHHLDLPFLHLHPRHRRLRSSCGSRKYHERIKLKKTYRIILDKFVTNLDYRWQIWVDLCRTP